MILLKNKNMTKEKKLSLLSLMIIPGLLLNIFFYKIFFINVISWLLCGIAGFSFGRLISMYLKK